METNFLRDYRSVFTWKPWIIIIWKLILTEHTHSLHTIINKSWNKCFLEITDQLALVFFPKNSNYFLIAYWRGKRRNSNHCKFPWQRDWQLRERFYGFAPFFKAWYILGSESTAFVQASLWHMLSCSPAFSEVKFYSLREARRSAWFANQSPSNFVRIEGMTKRKGQTENACFLADSAFLNNVAKSDFCCLETAFLRGRNVSLETGFEGFNHKRKDRVS